MKKIDADKAKPIEVVIKLIEKVVDRRRLDKAFHRDEVEKYFLYLLQGQDKLDPYERRDAGVTDKEWKEAVKHMSQFLSLEKNHEKMDLFT